MIPNLTPCAACGEPSVSSACPECEAVAYQRLGRPMRVREEAMSEELARMAVEIADAREVEAFLAEHGPTIRRLGAEHGRVAS